MPSKDGCDVSAQAGDSTFLLLVRVASDRVPPAEEPQGPCSTPEPEDVDRTPKAGARVLVPDCEDEDMGARGRP